MVALEFVTIPVKRKRFPGLDYPDVSASKRSHENIGEFRSTVMAGPDPAIQRISNALACLAGWPGRSPAMTT